MKYISILLLIASITSCNRTNTYTLGQYVSEIKQDVIEFENGKQYKLDQGPGTKTVYLVRHAEKDTSGAKNPLLTDQGRERSYQLARIFRQTRIDAVYSTLYNRTMLTVDSLVQMKGLSTNIYQPAELKQLGDQIAADSTAQVFLISGHSNTTPAMSGVLMGVKQFEHGFDESDYENLLVYNKKKDGTSELLRLKYRAKQLKK